MQTKHLPISEYLNREMNISNVKIPRKCWKYSTNASKRKETVKVLRNWNKQKIYVFMLGVQRSKGAAVTEESTEMHIIVIELIVKSKM